MNELLLERIAIALERIAASVELQIPAEGDDAQARDEQAVAAGSHPISSLIQQTPGDVDGSGSDDASTTVSVRVSAGASLRDCVEGLERSLVVDGMASAGGNQSQAARMLRISRVTLIDKLKKYSLF